MSTCRHRSFIIRRQHFRHVEHHAIICPSSHGQYPTVIGMMVIRCFQQLNVHNRLPLSTGIKNNSCWGTASCFDSLATFIRRLSLLLGLLVGLRNIISFPAESLHIESNSSIKSEDDNSDSIKSQVAAVRRWRSAAHDPIIWTSRFMTEQCLHRQWYRGTVDPRPIEVKKWGQVCRPVRWLIQHQAWSGFRPQRPVSFAVWRDRLDTFSLIRFMVSCLQLMAYLANMWQNTGIPSMSISWHTLQIGYYGVLSLCTVFYLPLLQVTLAKENDLKKAMSSYPNPS